MRQPLEQGALPDDDGARQTKRDDGGVSHDKKFSTIVPYSAQSRLRLVSFEIPPDDKDALALVR